MKKICKNCKWCELEEDFDEEGKPFYRGYCYRFPPQIVNDLKSIEDYIETEEYVAHPEVSPNDHCGEFKPKKK